jgi:hypothetical protein
MAALLPLAGGASLGGDTMVPKGKKVKFKVQSGYCERRRWRRWCQEEEPFFL